MGCEGANAGKRALFHGAHFSTGDRLCTHFPSLIPIVTLLEIARRHRRSYTLHSFLNFNIRALFRT